MRKGIFSSLAFEQQELNIGVRNKIFPYFENDEKSMCARAHTHTHTQHLILFHNTGTSCILHCTLVNIIPCIYIVRWRTHILTITTHSSIPEEITEVFKLC